MVHAEKSFRRICRGYLPEHIGEICFLKRRRIIAGNRDLRAVFRVDRRLGELIDMIQIHNVAAVTFEKALIQRENLLTVGEKLADLKGGVVGQADLHQLILRLQIIDIVQRDAAEARRSLGGKGFLFTVQSLGEIIHSGKELLRVNRLHQVIECLHLIGIHGKFAGRGQEYDWNRLMLLTQFLCGIHTVEQRHDDVQNDQIHAVGVVRPDQIIAVGKTVKSHIDMMLRCPLFQ